MKLPLAGRGLQQHSPLPPPEEKAARVRAMFDRIAPRYDVVNRVMTAGRDVRWRQRTVAALGLAPKALVLDLGCGTGDLAATAEAAGYRGIGVDYAAGMLDEARKRGLPRLVRADVLALPFADGSVDGVVSGFVLRNVVDVPRLLAEAARVLRRGGRVALLEISIPDRALVALGHRLYLHGVVPLVGGLLSDRSAYRYLPASTTYLPPWPRLLGMLGDAGFTGCTRIPLTLGAAQLLVGTKA